MINARTTSYQLQATISTDTPCTIWLMQFEGMIGWYSISNYNCLIATIVMGTQCCTMGTMVCRYDGYSTSNQAPPQFQPPSTLVALFSFKLSPDV